MYVNSCSSVYCERSSGYRQDPKDPRPTVIIRNVKLKRPPEVTESVKKNGGDCEYSSLSLPTLLRFQYFL